MDDLWSGLTLDMLRHRVVTLVGGGGKTTTLYALARRARDAGKTVIVTTTTHIMPHPGIFVTGDGTKEALRSALDRHGIVTLGKLDRTDKMSGTGCIAVCKELSDLVLVEGDGARMHPLKVPAGHEPVIPPESDAVIAVAGLRALDGAIGRVCHRAEQVAALLGKTPCDLITEEDIAAILLSPAGGRKGVRGTMAFRCLLNQADTPELQARGARIARNLERAGVPTRVQHYVEKERGGRCWF